MPSDSDFQRLWQAQPAEPARIPVEEIHRRALRFQRRIRWRNRREYIGAAIAMPMLIAQAFHNHGWQLLATLLLIAGLLYVVVEVWRRGAKKPPLESGEQGWLAYYRSELTRQRDALRTVWRWYLLPFVPGFAMTVFSASQTRPKVALLSGMSFTALLLLVGWLNAWAANKIDRKLKELDDE